LNAIINGINMAWDDIGSGPALCLIHGFPLDRRMWQHQIAPLVSAGYRVITPDLRGFGDSASTVDPCSMDLFADDLILLLDYLGIEQAIVGGMSMGGYVLLNLLERYPERVSAAIFIVTRSGADDGAARERRLNMARDVMNFGPQMITDIFSHILFTEVTARERPQLVAEVCRWMLENDSRGLAGGLLAMRGRKDYTPLLGTFRMPALIIGADQDKAVLPEHMRILAAGLPRNELCVIAEAGHLVNLEQPLAFTNCLLDFLSGLPHA
jgi:3-oxoadipate enol-lactonase